MLEKMLDELEARFSGEEGAHSPEFPDQHVVGLDGEPVPFHLGQELAWASTSRIVALIAGTQGGKTVFGPHWLYREIYPLDGKGGDYIAATANFDLFKLKLLPSIQAVFQDIYDVGRYWPGDKVMELRDPTTGQFWAKQSSDRMWGRIILRSALAEGGLEAATAKAAWLDEAGQPEFRLSAFRAIQRRLAIAQGRILITTTLYDLGWVHSEIMAACADSKPKHYSIGKAELDLTVSEKADTTLVQFDSIINPTYPQSEFDGARARMPEDEFDLFYRGRAARLRTVIYDVFNENLHVVPSREIPISWPKVVGVDPFGAYIAGIFIAYDPEEQKLHIYQEYDEPFGLTTSMHAANLLTMGGERVAFWCGGGPSERQARLDYNSAGLPMEEPPIPDVWAGIDRVYALFKTGRMDVYENCYGLIDELARYRRHKNRDGTLTAEIENKMAFHLLDALRYAIVRLTTPRQQTVITYEPVIIV